MSQPQPETIYRNQTIVLSQLVLERQSDLIKDVEFDDCEIVGPAVLAMIERVQFDGCSFVVPDVSSLFWEVDQSRTHLMGAIGLINVKFRSCRIYRVGLAAPPIIVEQMIATLDAEGLDEAPDADTR